MAYKLIIMKDDQVLRELHLVAPTTLIGRRQHNDLMLEDPTVSGKHAIISVNASQITIEDLESTNGTYVNGDLIAPKKPHELGLGDRIVIGSYRLSLQMQVHDTWGTATHAPTVAVGSFENTSRHGLNQGPAAVVEILNGINKGRQLALTKVVTTIGTPGEGVISLTHRLNAYAIKHIEGEQIVRINGQPLQGDSTKLNDGDRIQLTGIEMQFKLLPV